MNEIEKEAIDLRFSLHKVREICLHNAKSNRIRKTAQNEFSALADYIGCLLLKNECGDPSHIAVCCCKREEALLRWAEDLDATYRPTKVSETQASLHEEQASELTGIAR